MELLLGIAIGAVGMAVVFVGALRRAAKKPEGTTAKIIALSGGGGGGPTPQK